MRTHIILAFLLSLLGVPRAVAADVMPFGDIGYGELLDRWTKFAGDLQIQSAAVALIRDGELVAIEGIGERYDGGPVTPDTMFYIASITKTYTATAIYKLADEGRIDLSAPVKRYLPRFRLADAEASETMTIADLLSHTPGLSSRPISLLEAWTGEITEDRFYSLLRDVQVSDPQYQNLHFTLLGRVIESLTGLGWRDYLAAHVLVPAGLDRTTGYASELYNDADVAMPVWPSGDGYDVHRLVKTDGMMHAAGGLGASAADGAGWILLHMHNGVLAGHRVLSERSAIGMRRIRQRYDEARGEIRLHGYGAAWHVGEYRGRTYVEHGGGYPGAVAWYAFLPEERLGVVVMANRAQPGLSLADTIIHDIFDKELRAVQPVDLVEQELERIERLRARQVSAPDRVTRDQLALPVRSYIGTYHNETYGTIELESHEGRLSISLGKMRGSLIPTDNNGRFLLRVIGPPRDVHFMHTDGAVTGMAVNMFGSERSTFVKSIP